ncbi:alpha-xylosidase [Butyricicoccus sp.]|uniref:alpha-xylosidase n=1 Tax=Butyricicoccus sp. TaxID=2049021 RepID=UPI003F13E7AD
MKFSNGCWLQKEGCACFAPAEVSFTQIDQKKVTLIAPSHPINHRGDTLGGVNLTLEITAPATDVIRVKTSHFLGTRDDGPAFDLCFDASAELGVEDGEDTISVTSGRAKLVIDKKHWSMTYSFDGKKMCSSSGRDLAYMKTDWKGEYYVRSSDRDAYMRQQLSIGVGELIYGMGEQFTPFVRNGQSVDIWNCDGGTSTDQSYKNIPFYLSNRGYGIYVNHTENVSFEIATEAVDKAEFSVPGETLDYFFIGAEDMKGVLRKYTGLTGRAPLPAPWTFGLWLSTSFTTSYDEDTVMHFIDGMLERGIPLKVFHFDSFWMKEFHWCDFEWDSRVFPDPEGMLRRIKDKGLKICVWINPYIGQASHLFREGMEKGYFLKRPDGSVWQWDMWQPGMAIVDFTNPEACQWYQEKLERLVDMGVDCFKTDFGERIPTDCVYANGMDPVKMHNYYTYLYNKTVYELLQRKKGADNAVVFARSATVGGQKFPVHWGGDCWSNYTAMEQSLRGGLSLMMSGFGFWSHDIGGFEQTSTADVYKRWCAFGLLSSHSRLHGSTSYRVPWVYDEEAVDVVRFFTRLKARLMPYLYGAAVQAHTEGIPMMRSMVLEFPEDHMCQYLDKQYMLGDSLLVAPIFNEDSVGEYYLPEGLWTNFFTGEQQEGGKWYKNICGYCDIPLWVRPNSIVAVGAHDDGPEYDYADGATLRVYAVQDGKTAETTIYGMDGKPELIVSVQRQGNQLQITTEGDKPFTMELLHVNADRVQGADMEVRDSVTVLTGCQKQVTVLLESEE